MKPITKLYLKVALQLAITLGLVLTVWNWAKGDGVPLGEVLFVSIFTGLSTSLITVFWHRRQLKKMSVQEITSEHIKVHQHKTLESDLSKEELIEKLKSDPAIGKMKFSETDDGVKITSGMSFNSWGEKIKVSMGSSDGNNHEYHITSRPRLKTAFIDFGRNLQNVNRIENVIKDRA